MSCVVRLPGRCPSCPQTAPTLLGGGIDGKTEFGLNRINLFVAPIRMHSPSHTPTDGFCTLFYRSISENDPRRPIRQMAFQFRTWLH